MMGTSIFHGRAPGRRGAPTCTAPLAAEHGIEPAEESAAAIDPAIGEPLERDLIAALDAPLLPGESAHVGFARKERELAALFAAMDLADARAVHQRLMAGESGDVLVMKFGRLASERRARLLRFLADAPRREVVAKARAR